MRTEMAQNITSNGLTIVDVVWHHEGSFIIGSNASISKDIERDGIDNPFLRKTNLEQKSSYGHNS